MKSGERKKKMLFFGANWANDFSLSFCACDAEKFMYFAIQSCVNQQRRKQR